jgi:LSD1 subclass zinc finger protein
MVEIREPRTRRQVEVFALECFTCRRPIELAAGAPSHRCPNCNERLLIQWAARAPLCGADANAAASDSPGKPALGSAASERTMR